MAHKNAAYDYNYHNAKWFHRCVTCGRYHRGKSVRKLEEWKWRYFCSPECAKKDLYAPEPPYVSTEDDELHKYLDKL